MDHEELELPLDSAEQEALPGRELAHRRDVNQGRSGTAAQAADDIYIPEYAQFMLRGCLRVLRDRSQPGFRLVQRPKQFPAQFTHFRLQRHDPVFTSSANVSEPVWATSREQIIIIRLKSRYIDRLQQWRHLKPGSL